MSHETARVVAVSGRVAARGPNWAMASDTLIRTAELLLRGGACLALALLAALVLRDHGRVGAGWLGALFAAGTAAFTLCSAPGMHELLGWWSAPILAGASGNNLVFCCSPARCSMTDSGRARGMASCGWRSSRPR
ncbi:MAG: hypothetical protein ACHQAY_11405 [Hyphomicrobiales bacterium]